MNLLLAFHLVRHHPVSLRLQNIVFLDGDIFDAFDCKCNTRCEKLKGFIYGFVARPLGIDLG